MREIKKLFADFVKRFKWYISGFLVICLFVGVAYLKFKSLQRRHQLVAKLVVESLNKLEEQSKKFKKKEVEDPFLGKVHLRDYFLRDVKMSLVQKNEIWEKVSKRVEKNTNVQAKTAEVHGDILKLWQWTSNI
ncbi:unnamed protein product [Ambrosiozyma monospora]|uniref:Unnamed protein product n=1 Tax=Ambrosiozyma monospora TaxID=43982 RepID=A0ACB5SWB0_AMBMO|nr:unnamed protein product [Ambrosiozyma monospora]